MLQNIQHIQQGVSRFPGRRPGAVILVYVMFCAAFTSLPKLDFDKSYTFNQNRILMVVLTAFGFTNGVKSDVAFLVYF